ncbi:uncharacterized protein PV09_00828 [Verruconis gallopava]|uniref:DUF7727 domain-containing protein n=1 Tax=Verruconis gallopava TaxID=253628 RepID=A0A0D2BC17_9PEZI|nr:uncharacterized protein PV09_00828 [Verruconis gallopava]KIW08909.1 hypothetical protein PV09_00828 [Verruconis gallopava]
MGKLIKNHLARLIVLTAAAYQVAASLEGFFWPKIFWDFLTTNFDPIVKPIPVLQIVNLCFGLLALAWEWPVKQFAGTWLHQSIEFRLLVLPLLAFTSVLMYQSTNACLYYLIGMAIYFWGYSEGEIVCEKPWALPKREKRNLAKAEA